MISKKDKKDKIKNDHDKIIFNVDKPFRMFVGEIKGEIVKNISSDNIEGFKDGDKVVVMHSEDWLWFFNELLKHNKFTENLEKFKKLS